MADYTTLGVEKLCQQATKDPAQVRCPRDGVVMRVLACEGLRSDGAGEPQRVVGRLPRTRGWVVTELDLECPACGRKAAHVPVRQRRRDRDGAHVSQSI